ncbi:hypothetical protein [Streptomyces sp. RTd22]|uniref:hypothetical protein n=1 Tax=Streptomyces sp. RTd22 TaxID=1841249 RepID=UPI00131A8A54|nr:hypothetical protein [Streptomyces sp. RTd22]
MAATALAAFCAGPGFLVVAVPEGFFFAAGVFAGGVFAPADFAPVGFDAPVFPFAALFVGALFVPFMPFVPVAPFPGALLADPLVVGVLFNVRRISHPAMLTTGTYLLPRSSPPSDPACPSPYGVSLWPSAIPGR